MAKFLLVLSITILIVNNFSVIKNVFVKKNL
jgi:hypothetical protein